MALVSLENIGIAFGGPQILDGINCQIELNQRICLLGRNGAGKSTLMKVIARICEPDTGIIHQEATTKISYFTQTIPQELDGSVFEIIAQGLGARGTFMAQYHAEELRVARDPSCSHDTLHALHEKMDTHDVWPVADAIAKIVSHMSLNTEWMYSDLSGGQKRRVLLAQALVSDPDLLLLDEPTNHLDIDSIAWLEEFLLKLRCSILFVTHDRMLLRRLATRIIELDRGQIADWTCGYDTFLERKQALLEAEEKEWARFDKKLAEEEVWIRKGIKARRTRNEGRVRELKKMREERKMRREREGTVQLKIGKSTQSGVTVIKAENVSYTYDDMPLINDFYTHIRRGDKIGIVGPNGCGKTTLVKLLLGDEKPMTGTIKHGTNLSIAYFDQLREQLDPEMSARTNILPFGDHIELDGKKKHIVGYLQDFLFTPERAKTPVKFLSGGERNRLLLARLFTKPANVLVFDEPTNDLDAETLELLEDLLVNFKGTVLLICHDRTFLNNVVTSTLVFEGNGQISEFVGGYDDWRAQQAAKAAMRQGVEKKVQNLKDKKLQKKEKLSFNETRELSMLPDQIGALEHEQTTLHAAMADPATYANKAAIVAAKTRLITVEEELAAAYERWEYLESFQA